MKVANLPQGWILARLEDVATKPQYGWTTKAIQTGPNLKLLRTSDVSTGRVNWQDVPRCAVEPQSPEQYHLKAGDILVARAGSVGKSFLIKEDVDDAVFASYLVRFRPKISPKYVHFFMQSRRYWAQIEEKSAGIAIPNVNASKLADIELPVPPLDEQSRIVEKIETLFAELDKGEESLRQVQALLARYRQSVLKAAVTGELTADWRAQRAGQLEHGRDLLARILKARRENWQGRGKYREPVEPDTRNLPELPEGWGWATIDQVADSVRNGLSKKPTSTPNGFPILRISAARPMSVDVTDIRYYPAEDASDIEPFWVAKGDLLFTRYNGSAHLVGVCGQMRQDSPVLYPDKLIRVRLVSHGVSVDFAEMAWNTGVTRSHIASRIKTTSGQQGIAGADIKAAPFPLPPVEEQQVIAARVWEAFGRIGALEARCESELNRSSALRQSILRDAFAGKLVPQDPSDEPASELLARIRAQRAAQHGKTARGRTAA